MTLAPIASRRMRFGDPTSSFSSGVIVAALSPFPAALHRFGRIEDYAVCRRTAVGEREIVPFERELEADDRSLKHAQSFQQQLLPGLVSLENDERWRRQMNSR